MGGKNCVIVDADADLDDVVPGIIDSAFAYAGQKCSAASRVLCHEAIADTLLERLAGAAQVLVVGQADTFGTTVPPVIERDAQERVARYAELAAQTGRIVTGADAAVPEHGWFRAAGDLHRPPRRLAGAARGDLRAAARGRGGRERRGRRATSSTRCRSR